MANLPNEINKILAEETAAEQPVSEAVVQKIGKNINALIDRSSSYQEFLANGTFTVPEGINRIFVMGAGGGGGGGKGADGGGGGPADAGGGGGSGAVPTIFELKVSDSEVYTINIGAGGSAGTVSSGGTGGNTTISGPGGTLTFYGALGGGVGVAGTSTQNGATARYNSLLYTTGGKGAPTGVVAGAPSAFAAGGAAGTGAGGGGGGAGKLAGAAGGSTSAVGSSAAANSSAGGGGGGGSGSRNGGAGGSGYMLISW